MDSQVGASRLEMGKELWLDLQDSLWGSKKCVRFLFSIRSSCPGKSSFPEEQKQGEAPLAAGHWHRQKSDRVPAKQVEIAMFSLSSSQTCFRFKSSKYSLYTFLPLNLIEQFRRAANIYFLVRKIIISTCQLRGKYISSGYADPDLGHRLPGQSRELAPLPPLHRHHHHGQAGLRGLSQVGGKSCSKWIH